MMGLQEWYHAYVIEGNGEVMLPDLHVFFEKEGIAVRGNPDYHLYTSDQFLIDDAHRLIREAYVRPVGEKKIFVYSFGFITHEAQNALLKLFEEPPRGTHFFLIVPTISLFLPTVLSRVHIIHGTGEKIEHDAKLAQQFLTANKADRIAMAKDISADRVQAARFLDALEHHFATHDKTREALEALYHVKTYARDRGSSAKLLLEYLALML